MPGPDRIEGYAIVSVDGMLTDATGVQPDVLRIKADQKFFRDGLSRADAGAHGRNSYDDSLQAATWPRLILTRKIAALAHDQTSPNVWHWNPATLHFLQASCRTDRPPTGRELGAGNCI